MGYTKYNIYNDPSSDPFVRTIYVTTKHIPFLKKYFHLFNNYQEEVLCIILEGLIISLFSNLKIFNMHFYVRTKNTVKSAILILYIIWDGL